MSKSPRLILRLGTHAEKEYVEKTASVLDGLILGANLVESTPGASASLLLKLGGKKRQLPFYIDPMTYAFGLYVDRDTHIVRDDLDWIKSEQKVKGTKETRREFKRSYRMLAERFGAPFDEALRRGKAVTWKDLSQQHVIEDVAKRVVDYQFARIHDEFAGDTELKEHLQNIPRPSALFAPYFYCDPEHWREWLSVNVALATAAASQGHSQPIHAIICAEASMLGNAEFLAAVEIAYKDIGLKGLWFWFSRFSEERATLAELKAFRALVETMARVCEVYNLHGGFFSLALAASGMVGVSHGIGYGEQKDVVPVIGQSTPTVRYYLPALHRRLGVLEIERCFDSLGVRTVDDFYEKICDCVVCRGIVASDVRQFEVFGERHLSVPTSKRLAQTPAAAKRCRFHFLVNRLRERDQLGREPMKDILAMLDRNARAWEVQPSVGTDAQHLDRWRTALEVVSKLSKRN